MNRKYHFAPALLLVLLVLSAASCPPDRAALNTLKSARLTAEHAVAVIKAGRLLTPPLFSDAQEAQARVLYGKYLAADKVAAEALYASASTADTATFVSAVSKAAADLAAFVSSLQKGP